MLKIGIIGAGTMGSMHADCYSEIPNAEVVAVADSRLEAAKNIADKHSAQAFTSGDEVMAMADVDIVDICLPTPFHKENVLKVAAVGKHVFCEKPISRNMADGREMVAACRDAGVKFMVGHVLRYFHEYAAAKKLIDSGAVGKPGMVRTTRAAGHPQGWSNWYANMQMAGGVVLDMIIHDFDFLRWCLGEVERIYAKGLAYSGIPEIDYALVTIKFKSGAIAHVEGSWAHPPGFFVKLEVAGDGGMFQFDSRTASPLIVSKKVSEGADGGVEVPQNPVNVSPYTMELAHFVQCVAEDKEPEVTGEEALSALEIALGTLESIKTGMPVQLPLA